ncbi:MAG: exodeoxyribonuclease VII large subunit [Clostridiales bacterium]|nr:exodeoxyribonuclease VII large subunit [Clostridiales bacterium]
MTDPTPVFSVSEINEYVRLTLANEPNLAQVSVRGEISGFHRHQSGHLYFTLKDANASVSCAMFAMAARKLSFIPKDGMQVCLRGEASLYVRSGSFQLIARDLRREGEGDLYRKFIEYKDALEKQGYFDAERKKSVPAFPHCVGIVTSPGGAVLHDIQTIIARRYASLPTRLYPAAVQGIGAAVQIAAAITLANRERACDVLIVGRGGGSLEDLWAFNEPAVAKAIFESKIPVISAVGHETDFTIADFVADLRAPTPSAAAELAVPERAMLAQSLTALQARLYRAMRSAMERKRRKLTFLLGGAAFLRPLHRLETQAQYLSELQTRLTRTARQNIQNRQTQLENNNLRLAANDLQSLWDKGFVYAGHNGAPLTSAASARAAKQFELHFADGRVDVGVIV